MSLLLLFNGVYQASGWSGAQYKPWAEAVISPRRRELERLLGRIVEEAEVDGLFARIVQLEAAARRRALEAPPLPEFVPPGPHLSLVPPSLPETPFQRLPDEERARIMEEREMQEDEEIALLLLAA